MNRELELDSPFLVKTLPGFTPLIGQLLCMMAYARMTTLEEVQGLTTAQLDHLPDAEANSIGMLLEHITCLEESYQKLTLDLHFDEEADARRKLGGDLGPAARERIRGYDLDAYLERLSVVRQRTLGELAKRDDAWLLEESNWWGAARPTTTSSGSTCSRTKSTIVGRCVTSASAYLPGEVGRDTGRAEFSLLACAGSRLGGTS